MLHTDAGPQLRATVCVPTRNRADLLRVTLASLDQQAVARDRLQVAVADDGSTDGTMRMLQSLRVGYELLWTRPNGRGLASARNAAAGVATHEVVIFLDDDQVASPDFVAAHLEAHQCYGDVLVQGDYPLAPGHDRTGASLVYERARGGVMAGVVGRGSWHIWGGNFSVRRQTWLEVGGCDETLREYGAEDTEIGLRFAARGLRFVFEPRARSYHRYAVSPRRFGQRAFSDGRAVVRVARKHALPLEAFAGSAVQGPVDCSVQWGWRSIPWLMEGMGRVLTVGLQGADLIRVRRAQVTAARLVRRFYRVGGITREQQW